MKDDGTLSFSLLRDDGWDIDSVRLRTIGVDIGTSSTILSVASLSLKRMSRDLSSQFTVVSRRESHGSRIMFTPYTNDNRIDGDRLKEFIDEFYSENKIHPDDVDTGVVILTGEALLKKNSEAVANVVSIGRGKFVTIAAGHTMEATLAAFGSGSVSLSEKKGKDILNVDIGGGTTKLSVIKGGRIVSVHAVRVGGHVIVRGPESRIIRMEESGEAVLKALGYKLSVGEVASDQIMHEVSDYLVDKLVDAIFNGRADKNIPNFLLTPLPEGVACQVDSFTISGGVGEHFYDPDTSDLGDLGKMIADSLRMKLDERKVDVMHSEHCIRATVMGLSQYTAQISGSTVYVSHSGVLPLFNIRTVKVDADLPDEIDSKALSRSIRERIRLFEVDSNEPFALFFNWNGAPSYRRIRAFAEGVIASFDSMEETDSPLVLIFDEDVAWILGELLHAEMYLKRKLVCIDGISLGDLEFIDIGKRIYPAGVLPLTVKSLIFH